MRKNWCITLIVILSIFILIYNFKGNYIFPFRDLKHIFIFSVFFIISLTGAFIVVRFPNGVKYPAIYVGIVPMLVYFGPKISFLSFLSCHALRWITGRREFKPEYISVFALAYVSSFIVYDLLVGRSFILAILFFVITFEFTKFIIYILTNKRKREIFSFFLMSVGFSTVVIPGIFLFKHHIETHCVISFTEGVWILIILMILWKFLSMMNTNILTLKETYTKMLAYSKGLEKILEISKSMKSTSSLRKILQDVVNLACEYFGYSCALISIMNYDKGIVERVAYYGLSEEKFEMLKNNPLSLEEARKFFQDRYRIGKNAYFIPEEEANQVLPNNTKKILFSRSRKKKASYEWHDGDLFAISFVDSNGIMIGYLSLDQPKNGRRPTMDEVKILEIFSEQILRIMEDAKEFETLWRKSIIDEKTGLYNYAYFMAFLKDKIKNMISEGKHLSIMMMDMDNFKQVNDKFGHLKGDQVLKKVGEVIKKSVRDSDVVCRYGGDEFAIVLPSTGKRKALKISERILKSVNEMKIVKNETRLRLGISIGIAGFPEDGKNAEELVASADRALYRAKRSGKNRICLA